MQTCIMSSLPRCIFRCNVFRYVTLVSFFLFFFVQTLLFNCNSFTLVANKYLLNTYLLAEAVDSIVNQRESKNKELERRNIEKEKIENKHEQCYEAHMKEEMERLNKLVYWYKFKLD